MNKMNKWVVIPMIVILTIGTITNGVFYLQESNKLKNAQVEIAGLEGDISTLERDFTTVEGDVSTIEGDVATLEGDVTTLEGNFITVEGDVSIMKGDVTTLEGDVSTLEGDVSSVEGEVSALKDDISTLNSLRKVLEGDVSMLEMNLTTVEGDVSTLEGDVSMLEMNLTTVEGDVSTIEGDVTTLEGNLTAVEGDVTTLEGNLTAVEGDVTTLEGNLTAVEGDVTTLEDDISALEAHDRAVMDVVTMVEPSVVRIETPHGTGSGVIITNTGWVLTNAHVLQHANSIDITLANGMTFNGIMPHIEHDFLDLAMVKIDSKRTDFHEAMLGSSADITVGEEVVAMGHPLGLSGQATFTTGIVSAVRILDDEWIQTDAAINGGNSGGPLVNLKGKVIGINTWSALEVQEFLEELTITSEGLHFAVPTDDAKLFIQDTIE
jgi:hypothetical protein